ncbi:FkbM family methyltransferase [Pontibacter aydingkolensis]|uniref:FkbM family methyltransferase n=1 Tax=Pontibacter aydingkolensis TaxID=1911536 RepID=A0ABS7CTN7_9BACT|nr:FkbM family methyltransferase [Pontibacter aydingkolensis]MBW7467219.1 FkbM family methyltransferase [Pontibacter aydingkolensis]
MFLKPKRLSFKTAVKLRLYHLFRRFLNISFSESYSQLGEDIAIKHILFEFLNTNRGVYVDVGCNHPILYSNSFKFYLLNWRGITIDLNKKLVSLHKIERKDDIQVVSAVSDVVREVAVYEFESDLVNSIDEDFYNHNKEFFKTKNTSNKVVTKTLTQILDETSVEKVDLLLIDVEGHDLNVLKSLDLDKYRPKLIVVEVHDFDLGSSSQHPLVNYLTNKHYKMIGYLIANGYFIDERL